MIEYDAAGNLPRIRSRFWGDRGNRGILYQWLINRVVHRLRLAVHRVVTNFDPDVRKVFAM